MRDRDIIFRIFKIAKKYWVYFVVGVISMTVASIFGAWPSLALKILADLFTSGSSLTENVNLNLIPQQLLAYGLPSIKLTLNVTELVRAIPITLFIIFTVEGLFQFISLYSTRYFGILISYDISRQLYRKLFRLGYPKIKNNSSGNYLAIILGDIGAVQGAIFDLLLNTIRDTVAATIFIIALLLINWKLTMMMGIVLPIFFIISTSILRSLKKQNIKSREISSILNSHVIETVQGADLVYMMNAESKFSHEFQRIWEKVLSVTRKTIIIDSSVSPLMGFVGSTLIGIIATNFGFNEILNKTMTVGDFGAFVLTSLLLYQPIRRILKISGPINSLVGSSTRIFTMLDELELEVQPAHLEPLKEYPKNLDITFNQLDFRYNTEQPDYILKGINLTVKTGQKVAFVGRSGAGKSSIIRLIPALYTFEAGSLTVAGKPVQDWDKHQLRSLISFVPQDPFLFSGTLRENLLIAKPDATDAEIEKALTMANVDFLGMADLDMSVIERGGNYSGGQRQRLGLARAFLKNSPILILDEPSSSLDNESEYLVHQSIQKLIDGKTVILVTHKLPLIADFDEIICFDKGRIVEQGTHTSLMAQKGIYHQISLTGEA